MLSINRRNYYIIEKIDVRLKMIENSLIDRTQLIKYNWVKLCVKMIDI